MMNNKFPVFLAMIEASLNGEKRFVKSDSPYSQRIWGTPFDGYTFELRKEYLNKPNCNFNCPPGRTFYCCSQFGCKEHCGFFEWGEIPFFSDKERERILSFWNNGTGFLRKDGCVLPRELRSLICLSFACKGSETKE